MYNQSSQNVSAIGAPRQVGEIESAMSRLGGELDTVRMRIGQLTERLGAVLKREPAPGQTMAPTHPVMATALGEQADAYARAARELQCQLDDLLTRLDL